MADPTLALTELALAHAEVVRSLADHQVALDALMAKQKAHEIELKEAERDAQYFKERAQYLSSDMDEKNRKLNEFRQLTVYELQDTVMNKALEAFHAMIIEGMDPRSNRIYWIKKTRELDTFIGLREAKHATDTLSWFMNKFGEPMVQLMKGGLDAKKEEVTE